MAVYTTILTAPLGAITIHRAVAKFDNAIEVFRAWNQRRRTIAALRQLTTAQLNDIGLDGVDLGEFASSLGRR